MSEHDAETDAIQAVVDRVAPYQDGAPKDEIRAELLAALEDSGLSVDEVDLERLVDAIEGDGGDIDVSSLLS
ncbi:hypothetical protein BH09ACT10_BH09ACT10_06600 [soil metagenome]